MHLYTPKILLLILASPFIFLLNSCGKINNKEQNISFAENEDAGGNGSLMSKPESCYYNTYLNKMFSNSSEYNSDYIPQEYFFKIMRNHEFTIKRSGSVPYRPMDSSLDSCKTKCDDLNLNKIYESLIALNIVKYPALNEKMSKINLKIINAMKKELGDKFESSISFWINNIQDNKISYSSLQRQLAYPNDELPEFVNRYETIKYIIGLPIYVNGKTIINKSPNVGLQFDYILSNSKLIDGVGFVTNNASLFLHERDYFFNAFGRRLRGYRVNSKNKTKTLYYGIYPFETPELKASDLSIPWVNQRDNCYIEMNGSLYNRSVAELKIPLVCGISGSTNLAFSPIFAYSVNLSEDELRHYILLIWSIFSNDTGHSLQEVLTSAKLISIYYSEIMENESESFKKLQSFLPKETIQNLSRVTKKIRPLGNTIKRVKNERWYEIREKIYAFNKVDPNHRFYDTLGPKNDQKRRNLSSTEKSRRSEIEDFFNHYEEVKNDNIDSKFGKYDDFLSHLSIDSVLDESNIQLLNIVARDCQQ